MTMTLPVTVSWPCPTPKFLFWWISHAVTSIHEHSHSVSHAFHGRSRYIMTALPCLRRCPPRLTDVRVIPVVSRFIGVYRSDHCAFRQWPMKTQGITPRQGRALGSLASRLAVPVPPLPLPVGFHLRTSWGSETRCNRGGLIYGQLAGWEDGWMHGLICMT